MRISFQFIRREEEGDQEGEGGNFVPPPPPRLFRFDARMHIRDILPLLENHLYPIESEETNLDLCQKFFFGPFMFVPEEMIVFYHVDGRPTGIAHSDILGYTLH